MRLVGAWLRANKPPAAPLGLVHGDFQPPNILVDRGTGAYHMVDWEIARVGDPREDLGWWVLACASQPPNIIAENEDAFFARYREVTGLSEEIINPATVAYFTVLSSAAVFFNLIKMTSSCARGETTAMQIAYMTNAMPFMHGNWIDAMRDAGGWSTPAEGVES
jgi:aminoglycoside phosphotransferase (APT) family kinase protein